MSNGGLSNKEVLDIYHQELNKTPKIEEILFILGILVFYVLPIIIFLMAVFNVKIGGWSPRETNVSEYSEEEFDGSGPPPDYLPDYDSRFGN